MSQNDRPKFKIPPKSPAAPAAAPLGPASEPPRSVAEFAAAASLVHSQAQGRALKPMRINFDVDPEKHRLIEARAKADGGIAKYMRRLIDQDLGLLIPDRD